MFGKRLREIREEKNFTQKQLAQKLNVDGSTVRKWELGTREPNFEMLVKIADLFSVSTDFLLGRKDY